MAERKMYLNLPDLKRIEHDHGAPVSLLQVFKTMLEDSESRHWGYGSIAIVFNSVCSERNFPDEQSFRATVLPIACMIVKAAMRNPFACSPSFQAQMARLLRKHYPEIRGRKLEE